MLVRYDGQVTIRPDRAQLVSAVGGTVRDDIGDCDVAIVGAGPRLEALVGAGVFYGVAGSEARAMADREVFVVGAGNSAGQAALHLARHARQVTMLVRGDSLGRSMSDYLIREIEATANISVQLNTEVRDGHGAERLEALTVRCRRDGRTEQVEAAALFALIGGEPRTRWLTGTAQLHEGYVLTGRDIARDGAIRMIHECLAAELTGPPVRVNRTRAGASAAAPP